MNSETSSSCVRSVEHLVAEHDQWQSTRARRQTISMEGWVDVPDPNYGAFDLLKSGVPHPGAIVTGISRFSSISCNSSTEFGWH